MIDHIPDILQYFVPGFCFLVIFGFFASKKLSFNILCIFGCLISFITISILAIFHITTSPLVVSAISTISLAILAILAAYVHNSKWFSKILVNIFHKTPNRSIWRDVIDFKHGSNLKVYLKERDYYVIGHFNAIEENGADSWLSISAFGKYQLDENGNAAQIGSCYHEKPNIKTIYPLNEIEHIEIF